MPWGRVRSQRRCGQLRLRCPQGLPQVGQGIQVLGTGLRVARACGLFQLAQALLQCQQAQVACLATQAVGTCGQGGPLGLCVQALPLRHDVGVVVQAALQGCVQRCGIAPQRQGVAPVNGW